MNRLEIGSATALIGVGVFQIHDAYVKHAGSLNSVRNSSTGSAEALQRLVDADVLAGGITLLAGGGLALATGKVYPMVIAAVAFGLVAWYYHAALKAHPVTDAPAERDSE